MAAIAPIKKSSILSDTCLSTSATIGVDVSISGSPGNLDPIGFNPVGLPKWVDRSAGMQIAYPVLTLSSREPTKTSRMTRVLAKLVQPILEVSAGSTALGLQAIPTLGYALTANVEFLLPERATLLERTAFFSMVKSLFFVNINASDGSPADITGSPLPGAVITLDKPY